GVDIERVSPVERGAWLPALTEWHRSATDAVTHSAPGLAPRRWRAKLPEIPASALPSENRAWFVNSRNMTMLKIAAGSFSRHVPEMPDTTTVGRRRVTLTQSFFLSDREV